MKVKVNEGGDGFWLANVRKEGTERSGKPLMEKKVGLLRRNFLLILYRK